MTVTNTVRIARHDGPDGDPAYNPLGLPDADPTDYTYRMEGAENRPAVVHGPDRRLHRNLMLKLDGGFR
ncbi:MAG: hypothetical protein U1F77_19895 [Kiritimatiellia bacterium]